MELQHIMLAVAVVETLEQQIMVDKVAVEMVKVLRGH
jgi:hypothetical protein